MKVVRRGTVPAGWWIGQQGKCRKCGAVVEFDASDSDKHTTTMDGNPALLWFCPTCDSPNAIIGPSTLT